MARPAKSLFGKMPKPALGDEYVTRIRQDLIFREGAKTRVGKSSAVLLCNEDKVERREAVISRTTGFFEFSEFSLAKVVAFGINQPI